MKQMPLNVLGTPLTECSRDPLTGFYRTGACETGSEDHGFHLVCIQATHILALEFIDLADLKAHAVEPAG